ncbi:MAG: Slam-dependent surface lipoprotein [Castellaniella sp.]|uniref:Slam-dependent surface lipoprotein n=1 Tax=Castellaniella sp. TaxID=1955812 RepID=UPI003C77274D
MKRSLSRALIGASLALIASQASAATVLGGTSNAANVNPASSTLFGSGNAGLIFNGGSAAIDLAGGPIAQSNNAISRGPDASGNTYLKGSDINFLAGLILGDTQIAQVWRNDVVYNGGTTTINSVRQMIVPPLPFMPDFGGLVIGKVDGSPVYFGEWAPKGPNYSNPDSSDLNMGSADRTVWYVGENPTAAMPTLVSAQYNVIGINQHNPENPSVYQGVLTANYGGSSGTLAGSIVRGADAVNFAGTTINSQGAFTNTSTISGQFYGSQAEALAGIYTGATPQDHVAFGGARQ